MDSGLTTAQKVSRAYVFAIDPTPEQANALSSHIGASKFTYNHLLARVSKNCESNRARKDAGEEVVTKDYLSTSHFALL